MTDKNNLATDEVVAANDFVIEEGDEVAEIDSPFTEEFPETAEVETYEDDTATPASSLVRKPAAESHPAEEQSVDPNADVAPIARVTENGYTTTVYVEEDEEELAVVDAPEAQDLQAVVAPEENDLQK